MAGAFLFSPDPACSRPWHPDHFTHAYRELADSLEITEPLKNLRHFNATQLLAAGVDLRTTAGRLGHSDGGATTLKVYAHWMRSTDRVAVEQLSTDLNRLRTEQAEVSGAIAGSTATSSALPRAPRPIRDVIQAGSDGPADYKAVERGLVLAIDSGTLGAGDVVPSVTALAEWFGVARSTAQRAVSEMGRAGRIGKLAGRWVVLT